MEALASDQIAEDKFKTLLTRGSTEIISFRVYRFRETAGSWTIIAIAGPALPRPFRTFLLTTHHNFAPKIDGADLPCVTL